MEIWYLCTWIKTDAVCAKELKSWSIFIKKLDHKRVHGCSEKTKNSIQCLKIMGLVQISWFHARIEWKKIDSVSDTWQCTPLASRRISGEVSKRFVVSDWICGWNESGIWFSTWNFLYREITIKYVSSENLVNFWFRYVYIKLFLGHIENQYIYLVSTWSLNAWNNRIFCMKSWTINCCIILVNYLVDSH